MMSEVNPTVSIAIPTLNEERSIEKVLLGFLGTKYPGLIEIFVADGGSADATCDIVASISLRDKRVKLISNPEKIQSAALNQILNSASGEIFLRADAHSDYAADFIERSVEALKNSGALDAGGAQRFVAKNNWQSGIALAAKTFFGSGGAKYRDPNYDGYADTVFLGCFWREKLLEMGGFSVARNEDGELSLRMLQESSQAIYVSSKIKVWYYPRSTWSRLWRQYIKYGRGRCLTHIRHPDKFHLRSRLPLFFLPGVIWLMACILASFILAFNWQFLAFLIAVCSIPFFEAMRVTIRTRRSFGKEIWRGEGGVEPSLLSRFVHCFIAMITMPAAYNYGYFYQLIKIKILGKDIAVFFE